MAKFIRKAAVIVGAVALVATGVGAGLGVGLGIGYASAAGFVTGALGGVSAGALGAAAAGLAVVSSVLTKKPKAVASPMAWQSDPQAGIPIIIGRAYAGGKIVYRQAWEKDNKNETIITAYSIGPVKAFETLYVDGVATSVTGTTAEISNRGKMYVSSQLGAQPEAKQLGDLGPPSWTAQSKLSGLAAGSVTLVYDTKGSKTFTTEPQVGYVVQGVRVYDPRKDDTYPGGSGPQRWNDETTWSYTGYDNPYLVGLTWIIGWRQNGKPVAGVGAPVASILLDQFVEGANVCDANGWKCGGTLDTTDDKWQRLKDILSAGGGEPIRLGAQIGCLISTPRVSLATIGVSDVIGEASVQATQAMRDRINAVVPRYMAEQSVTTRDSDNNLVTTVTWGMVAAGPIVIGDYVTFDGKQRQKQIDFEFVQGVTNGTNAPNQVAQLARYAIEDAREFGPITLPLKLRWMGYKPGDVVTANLPELGLNGQDILLLQRSLSPENGSVTMTARSETYAKHAFALGQTTTAPPTPSVTGPALIPTPGNSAWALVGGTLISDNLTTVPVLQVTGAVDSDVVDAVIFEYRTSQTSGSAPGSWVMASSQPPSIELLDITGVKDQTAYDVAVSYRQGAGTGPRLILGPAVAGQTAVPWQTGVVGPGKPEDGATVGAPPGTIVGDRNAETVVANIDLNAADLLQQGLRGDAMQVLIDARTLIDGTPVSSVVKSIQENGTDGDQAWAENFLLLGARSGDNQSWVLNLDTVVDSSGQSLAERFSTITAGGTDVTTEVNTLIEAFVNADGTAKAFYTLETSLTSNGRKVISGFTNSVDQSGSSTFDILADHFSIVDPNSDTPYTVFDITNGVVRMHSVEVDTIKVGSGQSISAPVTFSAGQTYQGSGSPPSSNAQVVASITLNLPAAATVMMWLAGAMSYSGDADYGSNIRVDGSALYCTNAGGAGFAVPSFSGLGAAALSAGQHTFEILWRGSAAVKLLSAQAVLFPVYGSQ